LFVLIQGLLINPYQAGPRTKKFPCHGTKKSFLVPLSFAGCSFALSM
jgi:hypothetical protein